jgi:hypothetical protein
MIPFAILLMVSGFVLFVFSKDLDLDSPYNPDFKGKRHLIRVISMISIGAGALFVLTAWIKL